jgi:hypothetical protein
MRTLVLVGTVALLGGAGLFFYSRHREDLRREQADICWRYYGSANTLEDRTEECLIFKYGWRQEDAFTAALDRWGAGQRDRDGIARLTAAPEQPPERPKRGNQKPKFRVTADSLGHFYQQWQHGQRNPFITEVLKVRGVVEAIERDSLDQLTALRLSSSSGNAVRAFIARGALASIPALDDTLDLVCVMDWPDEHTPILQDCAPTKWAGGEEKQ